MLDRLFEFIESVWEWLLPFVILDQYERGVILTLGKKRARGRSWHIWKHKSVIAEPGLTWVWPLGIEQVKYDTVVERPIELIVQSITTKDKKQVTIKGLAAIKISSIQKFMLKIEDGENYVINLLQGIITQCVERENLEDVLDGTFKLVVYKTAYDVLKDTCGVKLLWISWADKTLARSIRLWND